MRWDARPQVITADGKNVVPDVWEVLDQIKEFSDRVRGGEWRGATGQRITNVVAIGIGGSFLGPLFVHTALRTDQVPYCTCAIVRLRWRDKPVASRTMCAPTTLGAAAHQAAHGQAELQLLQQSACGSLDKQRHACAQAAADEARGRTLRFLANVDPVDVARALNSLDPATTMAVVVSKTFTTAETMLNARTVRCGFDPLLSLRYAARLRCCGSFDLCSSLFDRQETLRVGLLSPHISA